jgi:hypothetical protein
MSRTAICALVLLVGADRACGERALAGLSGGNADHKIEQILEQKQDMVFKDETLADLAAFLVAAGVPTYIDRLALDEVGLAADVPLTFHQYAIRLRDGLSLALSQFDLTWTLRHGRVIMTTPEAAESELITRVYDVRHLVEVVPVQAWGGVYGNEVAGTTYYYDFDSLLNTITSTVRPDSWEEVGGPGSIRPYRTRRMRVIVVAQTYTAHKQVSALLTELAKHGGSRPLPAAKIRRVAPMNPSAAGHTTLRSSRLRSTGQ